MSQLISKIDPDSYRELKSNPFSNKFLIPFSFFVRSDEIGTDEVGMGSEGGPYGI